MKFKKLLFMFLLLFVFVLTGCTFFNGDEALEIVSITNEVESDGRTKITITYSDETRAPDVFYIPQGIDGVGIKSIVTTESEDSASTILTITYTDDKKDPVTFTVPHGISIIGVSTFVNEEDNNTYMVVSYSNNTTSDPILLPKGEKGDEGNGMTGYDVVVNDDKSTTISFHFSKSEDVVITIPAPERGLGISSMMASEEDGLYVLTVNYTDGTSERLLFNKPAEPNKWFSGASVPSFDLGSNGDYYFDHAHKVIYTKENGVWVSVVSFEDDNNYYNITFELNDADSEVKASMPAGSYKVYPVRRNTYFEDNNWGAIPVPTRPGYKFMGWYRNKIVTPTSGPFTDITPILSNLTLYAIWELE